MTLTRYRLGDLIEQVNTRNKDVDNKYTVSDVRGISNQKAFIETKAKMNGVSLDNYKLVKPSEFVYMTVTSRNGDKLSVAFNNTNETYIVSSSYITFKVKSDNKIIEDYLFMTLNRTEFDRLSRINSWGSARETLSWEDFCDIKIDLPPLDNQKKYVAIYKAMLANQAAYEKGLEDLKLICFAHIEHIRKNSELFPIGNYIEPINEKNSDGAIKLEQGINIEKRFINPQRPNSNLKGRKIVRTGQFAYCTQLNNENVAIALREDEDCVVSSVYDVFKITKEYEILPNYLMLWLIRPEFGRYVYWASEGSAYEFLSYENLSNYLIPVPPIEVQNSIADIYKVYTERKEINEKLKERLKNICPILIKGAVEEAKRKEA
ncbi:restriction endonuclease subunit S [uncultured Anaerococcus sp.]|uniref:restriction endonuclease subunit S n=1 Tax=uncultured Anaerococcus sp. TaxID=293428 RepID=UPI002889AEF6|nr:restriction endonuclease subunit S [uncultured Anaerococcus sp.]